jgi:uncharacterized protein YkwD
MHKAGLPALVLLAVLAGCGGGGSDAPDSATVAGDGDGTSAGAATCGLPEFRASLLARVNQVRATGAQCGTSGTFGPAGPLVWNELLTQAAAAHSQDMSTGNYFSHTSQDGRTLAQRINATGYAWVLLGENIAAGQRTVDSVMDAWMGSPGHCANVMKPEFTEMGVACVPRASASNTYATYWSMELARPR